MLSSKAVRALRAEVIDREDRLPVVFGALSDPGRFHMFKLLLQHKDLCVTDIASVLAVSVSAASQQLKILELSGLIMRERHGQMICYRVRLADSLVKSLVRTLQSEARREG